ncbi:hypothetical protein KLP40_19190 [Hymenobacter sp. NST-14]|uniref:hypothetical protein n=1 Tax=Hymenobacter piscis TaxID=2839984 RepID=UPI001C02EE58|nr:hypothetical protein [Hymenobacter piscis]MBT9395300.1 hypothetical protein [Hymenobacter piscis]
MVNISTLALAGGLALAATGQALAQTELNSAPQPGSTTAPATMAAPTPAAAPAGYRPAPDTAPRYRSSLMLELGWGAPYGGLGISYAGHLTPSFELNGGIGFGVGGKIGVGARYYITPEKPFTPYVGVNLVRTGRIDDATVELDGEEARFTLSPSGVLHLRGGLRWQPGRVGLLGTLGYGARFTGDPVTYDNFVNPNPSDRLRDLVQTISPGGVEFSVGLVIGLGR